MILRDIDFGPIWGASGVEGFFGEGYWFHRLVPGLDFDGMTFVAKTTTLRDNKGFMPIRDDFTPKEWFPACIHVGVRGFLHAAAVNSVGLSGPGAEILFACGEWQKRTKPFMISFMSLKASEVERLEELARFVAIFARYLPEMQAPVGLQINFSCPNVGVHHADLVSEAFEAHAMAGILGIPLIAKLVCTMAVDDAIAIAEIYDAIVTTNTIRWGTVPEEINEERVFGLAESPLKLLDPAKPDVRRGGVSGKPLRRLNLEFIADIRRRGCRAPINASGGVTDVRAVRQYADARANGVSFGTGAMVRGWRTRAVIREAYQVF